MKVHTIRCVLLEDVCEANGLLHSDVMELLGNSDVSFGNNADTLITFDMLDNIVKKAWGLSVDRPLDSDPMYISIGS